MKKRIIILLSVLLLSACGGKSTQDKTKTCTIDLADSKAIATFESANNRINRANIKLSLPSSTFGSFDITNMTEEQEKAVTSSTLAAFGLVEDNSVEIQTEFNDDGMDIILKIDVKSINDDILEAIGFSGLKTNTLEDQVKLIELDGGACE